MTDLTSKQRAHLRSLAHHLKPIIQVGAEGVTEALLKTVKPATKKALKWYVRGINAWIEEATATGQLPIEYTALASSISSSSSSGHPSAWSARARSIASLALSLDAARASAEGSISAHAASAASAVTRNGRA